MSQNSQLKGAAPRELHAHRVVGLELKKIEARNRGGGDIWLVSFGGEATIGFSPFQGIQEHRQGDFPFIEDLEIRQIQFRCIRCGAREGATNGHWQAFLLGLADLHGHVVLFDDHSRNDHQLSLIHISEPTRPR